MGHNKLITSTINHRSSDFKISQLSSIARARETQLKTKDKYTNQSRTPKKIDESFPINEAKSFNDYFYSPHKESHISPSKKYSSRDNLNSYRKSTLGSNFDDTISKDVDKKKPRFFGDILHQNNQKKHDNIDLTIDKLKTSRLVKKYSRNRNIDENENLELMDFCSQ